MNRTISTLTSNVRTLDGGVLFGRTPRMLWAEWFKPDYDNQVELASRTLLFQEAGKNILVMAGSEALLAPRPRTCLCQRPAPSLLDSLAERGLGEGDIHAVLLSHVQSILSPKLLHALREGDLPRLLFPKARYLTGERHWFRARHPHPLDRGLFIPQILAQLQHSNRLELIEANTSQLLGNGWKFHLSDGHTPGQLLPEISMPAGPVVFAGDMIPATHWLDLPVTSGYDRNPECLIGEKERILDYLVESRGRLFLARDPEVALVKVLRDRQSRYLAYDQHPALNRLDT
ncbi:MBL fold metallo-hydrolase [Pseudomonas aeruginosa]|uniref:MBL fold metallo-hydrolase n=1 Tax=Pseudomonas aeruginosa TaxID=287 RepID=UPI0020440D31|nr:MBL fold metallo-hydrolase [Pseudomonas aeruginosa]MCM3916203.1 MBL fold metallo-hydrolase [Pseudomonas aeruginosa]MCM3928915.1 MBL fold metallo-hydrolase [Pseudomonas aeruginosa]